VFGFILSFFVLPRVGFYNKMYTCILAPSVGGNAENTGAGAGELFLAGGRTLSQ